MENRAITIEDVRDQCRAGAFRAYAQGMDIYLEDTATGGTVWLTERSGSPEIKRHGNEPGSRVSRMFGTEPTGQAQGFQNGGPYRGFLMVRCEKCGKLKAFCAKRETYSFRCDDCGHETPLENLRPMYMKCKCGKEYRYKTNLTDQNVSHACLSCHAPVDMVLNWRETAYVTVEERG